MNLKPLGDRVIVRRIKDEAVTKGGIILPEKVREKTDFGEVVAHGEGRREDGKIVPMACSVGDMILFGRYAGQEIEAGEKLIALSEQDIIAIVLDKQEGEM